jgi:magnesium transporter
MSSISITTTSASPTSSAQPDSDLQDIHDDLNPIISFIIGFSIILVASIMNAGGLNLVKLDMVRTMALPKAQRRRDWLRPLWLIGMVLYITSQLIGSTLALEFLRAEYVAPLGSSSLVFNFLFAR